MATGQMSHLIRHIRRSSPPSDVGTMTDGQLLARFLDQRDESAFEAIVRRHGPMVLGVCRRVLRNPHDAEDAFQATFLVLVRKAASLRGRDAIGNWLYGVAYHTALKARAVTVKQRTKDAQWREMPRPNSLSQDTWQDRQAILDQELSRLPDRFREPVVLCDLQGKTRREAARLVGVAEGTLSGRLTTAHRMLAKRLARRGVALSVASLAAALSQSAASARMPSPLIASTTKAAALVVAGKSAAGVISAQAIALTEGVLKAMLMTKLKVTAAILVVAGVIAVAAGTSARDALAGQIRAAEPPETKRRDRSQATANETEVQKILDKYRAIRPDEKDLTIFQLDWAPTLKDAREKAAKDQRPIFLLVVTNSFGNLFTGHC